MSHLTPQDNPVWLNVLAFAVAAGAIWYAGSKLERLADVIADRTGLGKAFIGLLLLAAATSLPEIATVITAVVIGNTALAVHNLLGAVVFNTAILAVADAVSGREALTHRTPRFSILIAGLGVVFLLGIVLTGGAIGRGAEQPIAAPTWLGGIGLWEGVLLLSYVGVLYVVYKSQKDPRWQPVVPDNPAPAARPGGHRPSGPSQGINRDNGWGFRRWASWKVYLAFAGASLLVLAAGYTVARTGDALAVQTGLGGNFVGFTLIAVATTLPELSTTTAAARAGNDEMAFSNVFGSCAFNIMLLAVVGILSGGQTIIQSASPSASFAASIGILALCIYLWGLLERRDRTILRMGWDSAAILIVTAAGSFGIYWLG